VIFLKYELNIDESFQNAYPAVHLYVIATFTPIIYIPSPWIGRGKMETSFKLHRFIETFWIDDNSNACKICPMYLLTMLNL
jgi:hypothetical protein